jgi:hypothetical protein
VGCVQRQASAICTTDSEDPLAWDVCSITGTLVLIMQCVLQLMTAVCTHSIGLLGTQVAMQSLYSQVWVAQGSVVRYNSCCCPLQRFCVKCLNFLEGLLERIT